MDSSLTVDKVELATITRDETTGKVGMFPATTPTQGSPLLFGHVVLACVGCLKLLCFVMYSDIGRAQAAVANARAKYVIHYHHHHGVEPGASSIPCTASTLSSDPYIAVLGCA